MNKKEFDKQMNALLAEAKALLKSGKVEDANKKTKEAEDLKAKFEADQAHEDEMNKAAANIAALEGPAPMNNVPAQVVPITVAQKNINHADEPTDSMEYRKAFMNYVLTGAKMPANLADGTTSTTEGGAVIPQTIVNRIIEKLQASGMILPLVTQTSYRGGVSIPVSLVKPTAEWVAEGADATGKKLSVKTTDMITFSYYKLKVKVAITLEMNTMAIPAFEAMITNNIAEAIEVALENAIINGDGSGKPTGILKANVADGQAITTSGAEVSYKDLVAAEAALPLAYENGAKWCMSKKQFMEFIGMVDSNKQPIARVNYGINGAPERTLLGRAVVLNDYVANAAGSVSAFLFNFKDYVLNTNLNMTVKTYEDNDTDDQVTKAIMLVDGKVVDNGSLVTLTKKTTA